MAGLSVPVFGLAARFAGLASGVFVGEWAMATMASFRVLIVLERCRQPRRVPTEHTLPNVGRWAIRVVGAFLLEHFANVRPVKYNTPDV